MRTIDRLMIFGARTMKKYTNFMIRNEQELEVALKAHTDVLVIFGHPLCQPCQKIFFQIPIVALKSLLKKRGLKFCNIRELTSVGEKFQIETTPTLIYFNNAKEKQRFTDYKEIMAFF